MTTLLDPPCPDPRQTAWDVLTANYGMVVRKWRAAWPRFALVLSRPEVLSASLDAAVRGVLKWRPGGGASLKTYVLNSAFRAAQHARERWAKYRRRCHLEKWDGVPAPERRVCDDDRLTLIDRLGPADRDLLSTVAAYDLNFAAAAERLGMPPRMIRKRFVALSATVRGWAGLWEGETVDPDVLERMAG